MLMANRTHTPVAYLRPVCIAVVRKRLRQVNEIEPTGAKMIIRAHNRFELKMTLQERGIEQCRIKSDKITHTQNIQDFAP